MTKQYPGEFDFKKKRGEDSGAFEWRMLETNTATTKYNWAPRDGRGVRNTKTGGKPFQYAAKPYP